jgi:hypothetical protein
MRLSLYQIEWDLQQLADLRELAESEGDSEALKVIDQQLAQYLTAEAAKVTSYVGLIRAREATVLQCAGELERIRYIQKQAQADIDRLKQTAMEVMNRFGVRELKATPGGGLRIQGNGGLQALETDPDVPDEYAVITLKLTATQVVAIQTQMPKALEGCTFAKREWDTERIREALKRGESVPGAKLLPRGQHVKVL